ncbi:MAG: VOC family protein, partial [Mesorhizobium sp.]
MKLEGKLDYLELPATGGTLDSVKSFYSAAFSWSFTDYGPTYSAFAEGLDGGFQADAGEAPARPLPVLYSENLEETLEAVENAGGSIIKPI